MALALARGHKPAARYQTSGKHGRAVRILDRTGAGRASQWDGKTQVVATTWMQEISASSWFPHRVPCRIAVAARESERDILKKVVCLNCARITTHCYWSSTPLFFGFFVRRH
jgi:hypothetical protein